MPLKRINKEGLGLSRARSSRYRLIAVAVSLALMNGAFYWVLDSYLASVGYELVQSWKQTELVNIQQGNLLSSVTKHQRVLLSSNFIQGVALYDVSSKKPRALVEIGRPIQASAILKSGDNTGFLRRLIEDRRFNAGFWAR